MTDWELKQHRANRENEQKGREVARSLGKLVNIMGGNKAAEDGFIDELTNREHRTLQQSSFGLMLKVMEKWSQDYENDKFDGRNEFALKKCKDIVEQNPDLFEFGVPLI